jgi:hypothetical protein
MAGTGPLARIHFKTKKDLAKPVLSLSNLSVLHSDLSQSEGAQIRVETQPFPVGEQRDLFFLSQNAPNPFNLGTSIHYTLPGNGQVYLSVYSMAGQRVRLLDTHYRRGGRYAVVWDGRDEHGNDLPSGVYFSHLSWNGQSWNRKMVLIR